MNIERFCIKFNRAFPKRKIDKPTRLYKTPYLRRFFDPCPAVKGAISIKKQKLLKIAFSCLDPNECYLEVGTYRGKSLISAVKGNPMRSVFACDNFTSFGKDSSFREVKNNLKLYNISEKVIFYNEDFKKVLNKEKVSMPVGLYFYDGSHDEESQYLAIKKAENLLSTEALVIVDDWRYAEDSKSYAKKATERAIEESSNEWKMIYNLPARYNGDHEMWWNGVGVFSFHKLNLRD
jgi:predicted O-methyltransferase YrrM